MSDLYKNYRYQPIPWYIRFLLFFKKGYISYDPTSGDYSCIVRAKKLFNKIYILDVRHSK